MASFEPNAFRAEVSGIVTVGRQKVTDTNGEILERHLQLYSNRLFVLRFYGPVNPMGSCRARSVYLTTRLLGRLSPLSG